MSTNLGTCRCGGVSVKVSGKPEFCGYCHCDDCRRSNGAPIVSFAGFDETKIDWVSRDTLVFWKNGDHERHFCKACGSPVAYRDAGSAGVTYFYIGFMEDPSQFPPEHHSYHTEKVSWLELADSLSKFEDVAQTGPELTDQDQ